MAQKMYYPPEELVKNAAVSGMDHYKRLVAEAEKDYEGYWANHARTLLDWKKPFTQVLDESNAPFYKWFADGVLNASYNCLDRHVAAGLGDKVAIIFEADDGKVTKVTYRELLARVGQFANALKSLGVKKGDRVLIYLPWASKAWWPCRRARASGRRTRWSSAAFPLWRCATASRTLAPRWWSRPTVSSAVARPCR